MKGRLGLQRSPFGLNFRGGLELRGLLIGHRAEDGDLGILQRLAKQIVDGVVGLLEQGRFILLELHGVAGIDHDSGDEGFVGV